MRFLEQSITSQEVYEQLDVIGNGAYGIVYKARQRTNESLVALKRVRVPLSSEGLPTSMLREISILRQLDQHAHPNIIRLLDICHGHRLEKENQIVLFLVFEHVEQDLATYIQSFPPGCMPVETVKNFTHQILHGIDFLHSHRILHRDLKPQNLLITNDNLVKLADFGLAKTYDFEMRLTTVVVTLWYRSPEVLFGTGYATPLDVWSIACIMAEMYSSTPLFAGNSEVDQLEQIFRVIGTPSEQEWPDEVSFSINNFHRRPARNFSTVIPRVCSEGRSLLKAMLEFDPRKRISTSQALNYDYFSNSTYSIEEHEEAVRLGRMRQIPAPMF